MKKILILFSITFSSFIIGMQQPEVAGVERELFEAIEEGNAEKVQQLIGEGVDFKVNRIYKGIAIGPIDLAAQDLKL